MAPKNNRIAQQILEAANLPQNFAHETIKEANIAEEIKETWKKAKFRRVS